MQQRQQLQNREQLLSVAEPWLSRRRTALDLVERTLAGLDPYAATLESLREVFPRGQATEASEFVVVSLGKAAPQMARSALEHLAPASGFVLSPAPPSGLAPLVELTGSHPIPSADAPAHAERILTHLRALDSRHQLVFLISGGGSSLLELPRGGLTLRDLSLTSERLMHAGADIQTLNVVRRALSRVKGGGLLRASGTARVTNFILSDVVGGPLYAVASGPTLPVIEPPQSAWQILTDFGVRDALPAAVHALLSSSPPTPEHAATPATWLVADNDRGVRLLREQASELGVALEGLPVPLRGEAASVGERLARRIATSPSPRGLVGGGETTVTINAAMSGAGGRNQELILGAARAALETGRFPGTLVSFGTDGIDGQSTAAGALLDQALLSRLDASSVAEALARHDSHTLLQQSNAALLSGATGTNVADLLFWLPD